MISLSGFLPRTLSKARKGYLHIGLPKTGTTSFQDALYKHRLRLLSDHGILYPSIEANHTNALCAMFLDDPRTHITVKVRGITDRDAAERLRHDYFRQMEQEIKDAKWDTLVLSAEGLANLPARSLAKLRQWLDGFTKDWTVIFWTRHPIGYVTSVTQQLAKNGTTFEQMATELPMPSYQGRLQNAIHAFGKDAIRLSAFEDAINEPGGVVGAFCRQIGLPESESMRVAAEAEVSNESLSHTAASILESLNRQRPYFRNGKVSSNRSMEEVGLLLRIEGPKFTLPASVRARARGLARPDVAWLNENFGKSLYLDIFEDTPFEEPPVAIDQRSLDSLALLLSDLANSWTDVIAQRRA